MARDCYATAMLVKYLLTHILLLYYRYTSESPIARDIRITHERDEALRTARRQSSKSLLPGMIGLNLSIFCNISFNPDFLEDSVDNDLRLGPCWLL